MSISLARNLAKRCLAAILYWSGVLPALVKLRLRRKAIVLMYHRVLPLELQRNSYSANAMFVTPETFRRHVAYLSRCFSLVSLSEFVHLIERNEPFPPRTCLITFDDGWHDNYSHALPILRQYGAPAALFVTTGVVNGGQGFWQEHLTQLLVRFWQTDFPDPDFAISHGLGGRPSESDSLADSKLMAREIVARMKKQPPELVQDLIRKLESRLHAFSGAVTPSAEDAFLRWSEIRQLRDSGLVAIGSHGQSHTPMTALSPTDVRAELTNSKAEIESHLGDPVIAIAYPNGDHNDDSCLLARECGYRIAFTTKTGLVSVTDDTSRLNRIGIHENSGSTIPILLCRIAGLL